MVNEDEYVIHKKQRHAVEMYASAVDYSIHTIHIWWSTSEYEYEL